MTFKKQLNMKKNKEKKNKLNIQLDIDVRNENFTLTTVVSSFFSLPFSFLLFFLFRAIDNLESLVILFFIWLYYFIF